MESHTSKIIRVGIIGYGLSGRFFHGSVIKGIESFQVHSVVTTQVEKIEQVRMDFPLAKVVSTPNELFQDPEIELVIICTPNEKHAPLAIEAMRAGKHVVIEKPFTLTTEEADQVNAVALETNRLLTIYQNRRFDSDFRTVKKILDSGILGHLVVYEANFDRFRPEVNTIAWRENGALGTGILYDLGSHLIDQALTLFGLPNEVYADLSVQRGGKTPDQFELILYYPNLKVILKAGMLVKEETPRFALYGTKGSFVKYGLDVQEDALKKGKSVLDEDWGVEPESIWGVLNDEAGRRKIKSEVGDYKVFYENVRDAMLENKKLFITGSQAKNTVKIIELAMQSNKEKKRVECLNDEG